MSERLAWNDAGHSQEGRAGGLRLFGIHWGLKRQDNMWSLSTTLPIKHSTLGQHYPTQAHAKVAAERLLAAFIRQVDRPAPTAKEANDE